MTYGWTGKILRVDLSTGMTKDEATFPTYGAFIGGVGFGYKVIWDEAPTAGPFDPENRIVFGVGPLTGTASPSTGRSEVISISPHVYAPGSKRPLVSRSGFGGWWGAELKFAGYDGLIIQGKAAEPVYIWINDGRVEIRDARHLWGKDTFEAQETIKNDLGEPKVQIACIGQAGENLVKISPVVHGSGNAAGQCGFGAVMGSKNLKAVAVRGTRPVTVADREALKNLIKEIRTIMPGPLGSTPLAAKSPSFKWWSEEWVDPHNLNQQAHRTVQAKSLNQVLVKYHSKGSSCFSCPVACHSYTYVPGMGGGRVSCTQWFYSFLGNQDEATFLAKQRCDQWGIDTFEMISMIPLIWYLYDAEVDGKRIIFHMLDNGLVNADQVSALQELHYPPEGSLNGPSIEAFLRIVAFREGFLGDCLAEGFMRAIDLFAAKFEELGNSAAASKLLEFQEYEGLLGGTAGGHGGWGMSGHYDPRTYGYYWAVNFAIENRDPNRHSMTNLLEWSGVPFETSYPIGVKVWGEEVAGPALSDLFRDRSVPLVWNDEKSPYANAVIAQFIHRRSCIKDILTVCDWVYPVLTSSLVEREYTGDPSFEYRLLSAVTGQDVDQSELDTVAERVWAMHRALTLVEWGNWEPVNLREQHDHIPDHFFRPEADRKLQPFPPAPNPHPPLERERFEASKTEYYKLMGWDPETGIPTRATFERLGLKDVADKLEERGIALK